ncbi:uncharacterized protein [Antedon mediterranea]
MTTLKNSSFLDDDEDSDNEEDTLKGHIGAYRGDLKMVTQAISSDPSALEYQDMEGLTPLSKATQFRQFDVMKMLVKMGADLNTRDAKGRTPLCLAAYEGWYEGVLYLLRNGAHQNITDENGRLPLHAATYCSDTRLLTALLQSLRIDDVNQQDNDGMTALHWAAFHGRHEHVKLLMLRGTDIFITDVDEKTPLHWASQNGSLSCCKALVHCNNGGSSLVNCLEASGKTCVHLAAAAGRGDIIEEFSSIPGVDFEALDPDDRTPLHWAAVTGQVESLKILLKLGLNVSVKDVHGGTPLDYATKGKHTYIISILKDAGAKYGNLTTKPSSDGKQNESQSQPSKNKFLGIFSSLFGTKRQDTDTTHERVEVSINNPEKSDIHSNGAKQELIPPKDSNGGYIDNQLTCDVTITLEPSPLLPKSQKHIVRKATIDLLDDTDEEDDFVETVLYSQPQYTFPNFEKEKTDHIPGQKQSLQKYSPLPAPASMKQDVDSKADSQPLVHSAIDNSKSSSVESSARQILEAQGLNSHKLYSSGKGRLPVLAYRGSINNNDDADQFSSKLPWLQSDFGSLSNSINRRPLLSLGSAECVKELDNIYVRPPSPKLKQRPRSKSLNLEGCSVIASMSAASLCPLKPHLISEDSSISNKKSSKKKKSKKTKNQPIFAT